MRVTITGRAFVVSDVGEVSDPSVLARFHDVVYDQEVSQTTLASDR